MKHSTAEKLMALNSMYQYRGLTLLAIVNKVSRSGMSRRIEFYSPCLRREGDKEIPAINRIGYLIAKVIDWPYDVNKGGILAKGCGMDMIFHTLYTFNIVAARLIHPEMTTEQLYGNENANGFFFPTFYTQ